MSADRESHLAPYATSSARSGGRQHHEPDDPLRSALELDRHRIVECPAFKRLAKKTQVFTSAYHDHFRTRLTHTLEASLVARTIARNLDANETLSEVIVLAHDLGHPPFGHAGEAALNEAMADHGGFNHNLHSLRVVEYLEHPYPGFRGLNLTEATRAGLATHQTTYDTPDQAQPRSGASVEAQIASVADRIAYSCHDLEDAIGAGLIDIAELSEIRLWRAARHRIDAPDECELAAVRRPVLDGVLNELISATITASRERLASLTSPAEVANSKAPSVVLTDAAESDLTQLEAFLRERVYQQQQIAEMDANGRRMVLTLFEAYLRASSELPERFRSRVTEQGVGRVACDYIAGMTDRFCKAQFEALRSAS